MSWLTNYFRPPIHWLRQQSPRTTPDDLWHKCPACKKALFHRELKTNLYVCVHCDHHLPWPARERLRYLFDGGHYEELEVRKLPEDPLKFRDLKRYTDRLRETHQRLREEDAFIVASGKLQQQDLVVFIFNFAFMGGSMGQNVGEGFVTAVRRAHALKTPLLVITASGGARMQEGVVSLMQLPKTISALQWLRTSSTPFLVLLTHPTTGGVSASFAMLGDIHLAEPGATIGFAGRRVIEQTVRETLPENFQKAEYLRDHGMVDRVVHRDASRQEIASLLELLCQKTLRQPEHQTDTLVPANPMSTVDALSQAAD